MHALKGGWRAAARVWCSGKLHAPGYMRNCNSWRHPTTGKRRGRPALACTWSSMSAMSGDTTNTTPERSTAGSA